MSISRQNLSVVIVTLKSENVVHDCIKSINQDLPIIVVEQSNNSNFKEELENKYRSELNERFGIVFSNLFVLANMPINRYEKYLNMIGKLKEYNLLLRDNHNNRNLEINHHFPKFFMHCWFTPACKSYCPNY